MKILVTGRAGFIGSNLALELERRFPSAAITILDDFLQGSTGNLEGFRGEIIKGGVEDEKLVESLKGKGFNFIYHLAAITDTTVSDEKKMMTVNVDGFKNILGIAGHEKAPVIYASSAGVYGNGPAPMKETQKVSPLNAYSVSKARMDEIALSLNQPRMIGLRYFNVYGPGESRKGKSASMIWQLACGMKAGSPPRIFKYGEQRRDLIHVSDVVQATIRAMEVLDKGGPERNVSVNVGTGVATDFNRVIEILNSILGTNFKPEYFDNPYDFYQNHTQADTALAAKTLGFKARYSSEEGIRNYLNQSHS